MAEIMNRGMQLALANLAAQHLYQMDGVYIWGEKSALRDGVEELYRHLGYRLFDYFDVTWDRALYIQAEPPGVYLGPYEKFLNYYPEHTKLRFTKSFDDEQLKLMLGKLSTLDNRRAPWRKS